MNSSDAVPHPRARAPQATADPHVRPAAGRAGFSLVEVLMAVTILGIILVALAGMTFITAQRSHMLAEQNAMQGAMLQEINRLYVAPWGDLQDDCAKLASGNYVFERCISIAAAGAGVRRITVVLTSPRYPKRPTSLSFVRARPLGSI